MFADHSGRSCRAETQTARVDADADQLGNPFDIDERGWLPKAGAELNKQVRAAGKNARPRISLDEAYCFRHGPRRLVTYSGHPEMIRHACDALTLLDLNDTRLASLAESTDKSSAGPKRNAETDKIAKCEFHSDSRRSWRTLRSS
jgi:hypothetical protein